MLAKASIDVNKMSHFTDHIQDDFIRHIMHRAKLIVCVDKRESDDYYVLMKGGRICISCEVYFRKQSVLPSESFENNFKQGRARSCDFLPAQRRKVSRHEASSTDVLNTYPRTLIYTHIIRPH